MPVGTSAYQPASIALNLARACLNDSAGNLFSDTVLLPYLNSCYRQVQRALSVAGDELFINDNVIVTLAPVVTPDPAVQTSLTDNGYDNGTVVANPPQLPTDLLEPTKLEERQSGTGNDFIEMTDLTSGGGLPSIPQGGSLGIWEWRTDGLYFIGSTIAIDLRIRYKKAYPDIVLATDPLQKRQSADCIAYNTAAMAAMARGSPLADKWAQAGEQALENLVAAATRRDQNRVRRRRPNSSRTGGYWGGWGWGWYQ
jgi:hypothetical protein